MTHNYTQCSTMLYLCLDWCYFQYFLRQDWMMKAFIFSIAYICWGLSQLIDSVTLSFVFLSFYPSGINLLSFVEKPLHSCLHQFEPHELWEHTLCPDRQKDDKLSKNHLSPHCRGKSALLTPSPLPVWVAAAVQEAVKDMTSLINLVCTSGMTRREKAGVTITWRVI